MHNMIPKTENEREILDRIQRLEAEQFGGTKEQNYQEPVLAREQMTLNDGKELDGKEREFIGNDSYETLKQSFTALGQTKMAFRDDDWIAQRTRVGTRFVKAMPSLDNNQIQNLTMLMQRVDVGEIEN